MFQSATHLPQVLEPEQYYSPEQHAIEYSSLMVPNWHFVGSKTELANEGDYLTTNLLGRPLIIWNRAGRYRAFLNICPHRFSTITDAERGQCSHLQCQYHGWEFDEHGDTRKIPDAVNFRPLKKGMLGLTEFHVAELGNLIFVNLSSDPQPIAEQMGDQQSYIDEFFSGDRELVLKVEQVHAANWKIVVENALESYHVSMVHANTFGTTAKAEACQHVIEPGATKFIEDTSLQDTRLAKFNRRLLKFIKYPSSFNYQHVLIYPNGMLTSMPPFSLLQWTLPTSPTESISRWQIFGYFGTSNRWASKVVRPFATRYAKKFVPAFLNEDQGVQEAVQRGLQSHQLPKGGLVSSREERIFHFQKMILAAGKDGKNVTPENTDE